MLQLNSRGSFSKTIQLFSWISKSLLVLTFLINLIPNAQSTIFRTDQPRFVVGFYNLFPTPRLTTYPFSSIFNVSFANTLPVPTTYYDLVISLNSYNFIQANTIGWNFTKSNLTLTGFVLKYQAGLNSVIYQLAINYLLVDNDFQDIQIAYFNITCQLLPYNTGFRSENVSYTFKKFKNDSSIVKVVFLESFNLTDTQNDQPQFRKAISGMTNLTFIIQFYVWGLTKIYDFQFYIIGHNKAYMQDTYERYVFATEFFTIYSSTLLSVYSPAVPSQFKFASRLFTGINGLGFSKTGNKRVEFLLHNADNFNFLYTVQNGAYSFVDYSFIGMYKITCGASEYYRDALKDCTASCLVNQYIDSTHSPSFCRACHYTCATCYDYKFDHCITCSSATRYTQPTVIILGQQLYKCVCNTGMFDRYQANCYWCSSYLTACTACSDNSTCTGCPVGMKIFNNKCVCNNPNQISFGAACVNRIIGCQSHITIGAFLNCTECYVQRNFTITAAFGCACQDTVHQKITDVTGNGQFWCLYTCGDGYLSSNEQCDDFNLNNFDGCSSLCTVERNFTCTNTLGAQSLCQYNLSIQLMFHSSERVLYQNTAILNFTIQPYIYLMSQINISSIVDTTMALSKIEHQLICPNLYTSLRCNLTLTVQYTHHLQHEQFMLTLNFSSHPHIKYDSRPISITPLGNVALLSYQKESTLSLLQNIQIIVLVLTILTITIFLASIYFQKMIGVELIITVQYIYYILTPIKNNPVELVALQRNLKYTTGFNHIYNYTFYRYEPLPNELNHQFYEKQFLMNMNIMFVGLLLVISMLIIVKLIKTCQYQCKSSQNSSKIFEDQDTITKGLFDRFQNFYWNKIFFIYVFFVMYEVLFSAVVTTILQNPTQTYFSASFNFFAAFLSFFIIVTGILSVGYWYYQGSRKKGRISLEQNKIIPYEFQICKKQYILVFALIQPVKIWIVAIFYGQVYCYYIIIAVCFLYFVFLAVIRPYAKNDQKNSHQEQEEDEDEDQYIQACMSIHNFGICFNQFSVLFISVMCLLWNISINNYDFDNPFPQFILYSAIVIIFLLDVIAVLRIFYKKIAKLLCCQSYKSADANAMNADSAFAKMRKIIREGDLKGLDDTDYNDDQNGDEQKNINPNRKEKMKLLQDIKKAKNFFINWKDDPKPKFNNSDLSSHEGESLGQEQKNAQNLKKSQNSNDANSKASTMKNRNDNNSGIVEMQTLMKAVNHSRYNIAKTSQKKTAQLNKSIIDVLLEKKQLQSSRLRAEKNIYINEEGQGSKKKDAQNLNQVKQRLRKQFLMKKVNFQK